MTRRRSVPASVSPLLEGERERDQKKRREALLIKPAGGRVGACVAATAFHPGATARIPELTERSRRMKCKATRRAGARGSHDDKWTVAMAKIERFFRGSCRHRRFLLTGFPALSLLALSLPPNDGFLFAFALSFSLSPL